MLDIGWSEMAVIALLALVVIGPKDLPRVMRTVGKWAHKARAISREFQSGIDEMVREADLEDAKKTLDSTRKIGLDKVLEDTIDPTGSIKQEARDLQSTAQDIAPGGNRSGPDATTSPLAAAKSEPAPEASRPESAVETPAVADGSSQKSA